MGTFYNSDQLKPLRGTNPIWSYYYPATAMTVSSEGGGSLKDDTCTIF